MSSPTVLMVNKFLYARGGAEDYMLSLAGMLENAGASCAYYGMRYPRNLPMETERYFPSTVDFDSPSGMRERARTFGRMVYSSEAHRGMTQLLGTRRVDLAHLHNIYHQLSPSILKPLRDAGVPIVMTVHDYKLVCPVYTLTANGRQCERCVGGSAWNALRHRCNRGSLSGSAAVAFESWLHRATRAYAPIDLLISPSTYLRDRLIEGGVPADRVEVIPNFVAAGTVGEATAGEPHMLYAGRLVPVKGVDVLIRAVAGTTLTLRIAGEGPERDRLERLAAELKAPVEFLGHLPAASLRAELAAARALVVPSTWPENCPLIVLEALAAGKPVVASRIGGLPDLVRDGVDGILVDPGDVEQVRAAMLELGEDPARARTMGSAGLERAGAEYAADVHLARVLQVYRRLGVEVPVTEGVAA